MESVCPLCKRNKKLSFHHLIPKKTHSKNYVMKQLSFVKDPNTYGVDIFNDCHSTIHRNISHLELALIYNSVEKLLSHPEIIKFVKWASKQKKKIKR